MHTKSLSQTEWEKNAQKNSLLFRACNTRKMRQTKRLQLIRIVLCDVCYCCFFFFLKKPHFSSKTYTEKNNKFDASKLRHIICYSTKMNTRIRKEASVAKTLCFHFVMQSQVCNMQTLVEKKKEWCTRDDLS